MDGTRFDDVTKALAHGISRRGLLKRIARGAVAAAMTRVVVAETSAAICTPPGPLNYCNADSECCATSLCRNGICQCATGQKICGNGCISTSQTCGPQYCPAGYRQCGTSCIDTTRDTRNCGSCGHVCPVTQICSNSHCCPKGNVFCNGTCKASSQCVLEV